MRLVSAGSSGGDEAVPVPAFVSSFEAEVLNLDGGPVVTVRGDVDMATADRLWAVIEQVLASSERLVIDLSATTFIDSTGLGLLVRAHGLVGQVRTAVVVRSPSDAARSLLRISGVDELITIEG
jgi:anti-sigma B factor antagonist